MKPRVYSTTKRLMPWTVLAVCALFVVGAAVLAQMYEKPKTVSNFDECKSAGGAILESYPEQCLLDGKTYVNELQRPSDLNEYVGMTEDDALLLAEKRRRPVRVVERNGESLPVTMDFVYGRVNLYVKNDQVYKYDIEGEAQDAPGSLPQDQQ